MSWAISVQFDQDQADVGSVTGTWTDPLPALGVFTFSMRVKATLAGLNAFVAAAIAARDQWQAKQQANIDKVPIVLAALNAADPKAGG
jgi:hypothetical protein